MEGEIPGVKDARYRLLGLQAVPHDDGVIVRRGPRRFFVRGENAAALLDLLVERSAEGEGIRIEQLRAQIDPLQEQTFVALVAALRSERLLVMLEEGGGSLLPEGRESVFYWSRGASLEAATENVADVELAVFGVNHISLPLLGNLRSAGFRAVTFVDHPALRNLDFYDDRQQMRTEIAAALSSSRPQLFDAWSASGDKPHCSVVCSDFGGLGLMREWNRAAVADNSLFYPIVLQDEVACLGPLVVPGEGPCFECMWLRRNANLDPVERGLATDSHAFHGQKVASYLQPMARVAADLAAIDLLKYFSRVLPGGRAGRMIEADLMAPSLVTRNVLKVPRCPVCSRLPIAGDPPPPLPETEA